MVSMRDAINQPDPYKALIADLQALDTPLDPGVVAALATFWKSKDQALKKADLDSRQAHLDALVAAGLAMFPRHVKHVVHTDESGREVIDIDFVAAQEFSLHLALVQNS